MSRTPLLAGNWKMNPVTADEAVALARGVLDAAAANAGRVGVAVFPPFPWLVPVAGVVRGSDVALGAQNCYWEPSGAVTGEVSAAMLDGLCTWVLSGHSERRTLFGETDDQVARKAAAALGLGLGAIVCVGEREDEHEAGRTEEVVHRQLAGSLGPLVGADHQRLVVAYEPVWAIGTGRNADPEHAGAVVELVRRVAGEVLGAEAGAALRVLYGGSVKAANVASYVELDDCDGCLVGGASLRADEFSAMIESVAGVYAS